MIIIRYFKKIFSLIDLDYRKKVIGILSIQAGFALTTILTALLYTYYVNNVIYEKKDDELLFVLIGFLMVYVIEIFFNGILKITGCKITDTLLMGLRVRLWERIIKIPQAEIDRRGIADLKMLINEDVSFIETFLMSKNIFFINVVKIFIYMMIMIRINLTLTIFGIITIPIYLYITKYLSKKTSLVEENNREIHRKYDRWLYNDYQGWKDIKTLNCEKLQEERFDNYWEQIFHSFNWIFVYNFLNRSMVTVKNFFILYIATYAVAGYMVISGRIEIITVILFIQYFTLFMNLYDDNSNMIISTGKECVHIDKIIEQLNNISVEPIELEGQIRRIDFENVNFKYEGTQNDVLKNINISFPIEPGITAIVGHSGCGKSTLIKVLLGLYKINSGKIKINGKEVDNYSIRYLCQEVGCILQDSKLFPVSIRDNLKICNESLSDEEMKKVCRLVNIDKFIEGLPEQYDTIIGENSFNISGGQKQKLLLARLIIQDPKIIFLDESTSMIDARGCRILKKNLEHIWKDKMIIIISHKLEDVRIANRIILIENGKNIAQGRHENLYENNQIYRNIYSEQVLSGESG